MVDMQRRNPWSEALFRNQKIERIVGNAVDILPMLPSNSISCVIHDPPAQAMAGELYSADFYAQLARILAPSGCLFHYIGDPDSQESGRLFRGVTQRLGEAGFTSLKKARRAFGITGIAPSTSQK
jgi:uncharacterized protein